MSTTNCHVIFLFGKPMSGKGFIGRLMREIWGVQPLIAREMIRYHKEKNPKFAVKAKQTEAKGELLDDTVMAEIFRSYFQPQNGMTYGFDGIPRTLEQARFVIKSLKECNVSRISLLHLEMSDEESIDRFTQKKTSPDRAGRLDADLSVHTERLKVHREHHDIVLNYLQRQGVEVHCIRAVDRPVSKIQQIQQSLDMKIIPEIYMNRMHRRFDDATVKTAPTSDRVLQRLQRFLAYKKAA